MIQGPHEQGGGLILNDLCHPHQALGTDRTPIWLGQGLVEVGDAKCLIGVVAPTTNRSVRERSAGEVPPGGDVLNFVPVGEIRDEDGAIPMAVRPVPDALGECFDPSRMATLMLEPHRWSDILPSDF